MRLELLEIIPKKPHQKLLCALGRGKTVPKMKAAIGFRQKMKKVLDLGVTPGFILLTFGKDNTWQSRRKPVTQSYRDFKMSASCNQSELILLETSTSDFSSTGFLVCAFSF